MSINIYFFMSNFVFYFCIFELIVLMLKVVALFDEDFGLENGG